ncbi:MAG TPA: hypothetical protein VFT59_00350, partial [Candidatus Saccharimonadales bacterium]|nr:hypothetical protein [Candidatus Saccharimonadales bacterium]
MPITNNHSILAFDAKSPPTISGRRGSVELSRGGPGSLTWSGSFCTLFVVGRVADDISGQLAGQLVDFINIHLEVFVTAPVELVSTAANRDRDDCDRVVATDLIDEDVRETPGL